MPRPRRQPPPSAVYRRNINPARDPSYRDQGDWLRVYRKSKEAGDFLRRRGGWKFFNFNGDYVPEDSTHWDYAPMREYSVLGYHGDGTRDYEKDRLQVTYDEAEMLCRFEEQALLESGYFVEEERSKRNVPLCEVCGEEASIVTIVPADGDEVVLRHFCPKHGKEDPPPETKPVTATVDNDGATPITDEGILF